MLGPISQVVQIVHHLVEEADGLAVFIDSDALIDTMETFKFLRVFKLDAGDGKNVWSERPGLEVF